MFLNIIHIEIRFICLLFCSNNRISFKVFCKNRNKYYFVYSVPFKTLAINVFKYFNQKVQHDNNFIEKEKNL